MAGRPNLKRRTTTGMMVRSDGEVLTAVASKVDHAAQGLRARHDRLSMARRESLGRTHSV
jgi:hypothetical protein